MSRGMQTLNHLFVENVPHVLQCGVVYISFKYATVVHCCCCGCGEEVVTPLSPTDWKLIFDGETVSLYPSIGSWSLKCRSHYWITKSRVQWARRFSETEIRACRLADKRNKQAHFCAKKDNALRPRSV